MYLLDTNARIRILNDTSPLLIQRLASHAPSEIRLCSIVKAELIYGAGRIYSRREGSRFRAGLVPGGGC